MFEYASALDFMGKEPAAIPLYKLAIELGLSGIKKTGSLWFSGGKWVSFSFSVDDVFKPKTLNSHWIGLIISHSGPRKGIVFYLDRIIFLCLPPEC